MTEEECRELDILRTSKFFTGLILFAVSLSYVDLELQEKELICGEVSTLTPFLRMGASMLVVAALSWFFCLSENLLKEEETEENRKNFTASLFTLAAALLRYPT